MGFLIEGADYRAIADVTQDLIDKYRFSTPEELKALTVDDIGDEINNIRSVINNFQVPNYFILLGRTIGMLNGMAYRLNPEVNIIEIGKPYIREFFRGTQEDSINQVIGTLEEKVVGTGRSAFPDLCIPQKGKQGRTLLQDWEGRNSGRH